jgi:tetrahydromethanopterin S-methyltransferase subunit E
MNIMQLCAPAIIYLLFSITQILIDTLKGLYNTALMKILVTIVVTILLNILCEKGLGIVSWIIVFIPFILMTVIVSVLLYIFGLDAATGKMNYKCNANGQGTNCGDGISIDAMGNIIIYDPEYDSSKSPVYYQSPHIVIPNPNANDPMVATNTLVPPHGRSGYAYQS